MINERDSLKRRAISHHSAYMWWLLARPTRDWRATGLSAVAAAAAGAGLVKTSAAARRRLTRPTTYNHWPVALRRRYCQADSRASSGDNCCFHEAELVGGASAMRITMGGNLLCERPPTTSSGKLNSLIAPWTVVVHSTQLAFLLIFSRKREHRFLSICLYLVINIVQQNNRHPRFGVVLLFRVS